MNAASTTELDGATHRGPENAYPANAGEFAARWNAKTEDERNGWVAFMVGEAMEAQRADRNAIEWAGRVGALEAERDALRAENADLKEDEQEALAERNAALKQRDALRAQLDALTVEWAVRVSVPRFLWVETMRSREECERWIANPPLWYTHQAGEEFSLVRRTSAGPWVEVGNAER